MLNYGFDVCRVLSNTFQSQALALGTHTPDGASGAHPAPSEQFILIPTMENYKIIE